MPVQLTEPVALVSIAPSNRLVHVGSDVTIAVRPGFTDSALCLFGDGTPMAAAHDDAFHPVVAWAGVRYGTPFVASQSIRGADQSPAAVAAVRDHLLGEG